MNCFQRRVTFCIALLLLSGLALESIAATRTDTVKSQEQPINLATSLEPTAKILLKRLCEGKNCTSYITFDGPINENSVKEFGKKASALPTGTTVLLHSTGGDLSTGIRLGQLIRNLRLNTRVGQVSEKENAATLEAGSCYSTCAFAFLGGVIRQVSEESKYGFYPLHSIQKTTGKLDDKALKNALANIGQYFNQMGIDIQLLKMIINLKEKELYIVNQSNLKLLNVDNTASVTLNRWNVQALGNGKLIATVSEKNLLGKVIMTVGISKVDNRFVCTVFLKPLFTEIELTNLADQLNNSKAISIRNSGIEMTKEIDRWAITNTGIKANVLLSEKEVEAIARQTDFTVDLKNEQNLNNVIQSTTVFGTAGLRGALLAIKK